MTPEQRDALRQYITAILNDGDYLNDYLHTLTELGVPMLIITIIQLLGQMLAVIGGF